MTPSRESVGEGLDGAAPTLVRSWTMQRRPMVTRPLEESSLARGWTTDSELMLMVWWPVRRAESAMMIDEEKLTGALGPDGALGTIDWRLLLDDIVDMVWC